MRICVNVALNIIARQIFVSEITSLFSTVVPSKSQFYHVATTYLHYQNLLKLKLITDAA